MIKFLIDVYGQKWYQNNKRHRIDGPALIWDDDGDKAWYQNGKCHRDDGPAVVCRNGKQWWYQSGELTGLNV